jgi:hypothetical protein
MAIPRSSFINEFDLLMNPTRRGGTQQEFAGVSRSNRVAGRCARTSCAKRELYRKGLTETEGRSSHHSVPENASRWAEVLDASSVDG